MLGPATFRTTTALVAASLTLHAAAPSGQGPSTLTLNDAMSRAVEANRTLLAARTARAVDVAGIQAAGQRPNPDVSFEYLRETPHWAFTGTLPLDLSRQRQRRVEVANATLAVTEAETIRIAPDVPAALPPPHYHPAAPPRRLAIAPNPKA